MHAANYYTYQPYFSIYGLGDGLPVVFICEVAPVHDHLFHKINYESAFLYRFNQSLLLNKLINTVYPLLACLSEQFQFNESIIFSILTILAMKQQ